MGIKGTTGCLSVCRREGPVGTRGGGFGGGYSIPSLGEKCKSLWFYRLFSSQDLVTYNLKQQGWGGGVGMLKWSMCRRGTEILHFAAYNQYIMMNLSPIRSQRDCTRHTPYTHTHTHAKGMNRYIAMGTRCH